VTYSKPARTTTRRIRTRWIRVAGLLVVIATIAAALGYQSLASSSSTAASAIDVLRSEHRGLRSEHRGLRSEQLGALGEPDGAVPDGTTVFDDEVPGVANLDPDLLSALRQAATDAADDGVEFFVNSGWRSPEYQSQLLRETSAHVSGDAVDVEPFDATAWLSEHGAEYGLCQVYGNEPWHYELRPEAIDHGCAPMYADPTHDPRMQP
jgi:zinc D-Ala-D-Ala carboxypeptidase